MCKICVEYYALSPPLTAWTRGDVAISLTVHALMFSDVRQIWNILMLWGKMETPTFDPMEIFSLTLFNTRQGFHMNFNQNHWECGKRNFMNPIIDFLTLLRCFYCISLFMNILLKWDVERQRVITSRFLSSQKVIHKKEHFSQWNVTFMARRWIWHHKVSIYSVQ